MTCLTGDESNRRSSEKPDTLKGSGANTNTVSSNCGDDQIKVGSSEQETLPRWLFEQYETEPDEGSQNKNEAYFILVKFHQDMEKGNNVHMRLLLEKHDPGGVFLKGMGQAEDTFRNKT